MASEPSVVLITGASSGIGQRTAEYLVGQGYRVFGTSRHPKAETVNGVRMLALDVTDEASIQACVETVLAEAGHIDVLVNNAGVGMVGALEETGIDEAKWLFETNFFGLIRVTQTVLPHMRARRSGQIIHMGSASGTVGIPYATMYSASKHAVKGLTDGLRFELQPFGISVHVVQPGIFKSEIAMNGEQTANPIPAYDSPRNRLIHTFTYRLNNGPDSLAVARRIDRIITGKARGWLHPVGFLAVNSEIRLLFPRAFWDRNIIWLWNLTEQANTFFGTLMRTMYRLVGRTDGDIPPGLPPVTPANDTSPPE